MPKRMYALVLERRICSSVIRELQVVLVKKWGGVLAPPQLVLSGFKCFVVAEPCLVV